MAEHLELQASLIKSYEGKSAEVKPEVIQAAVKIMANATADHKITGDVTECLNHLAENPKNLQVMAQMGGIEAR